jgi:hypothetical protein
VALKALSGMRRKERRRRRGFVGRSAKENARAVSNKERRETFSERTLQFLWSMLSVRS